MDSTGTGLQIVILIICVLLSAFFSAADTAYLAANRARLKVMAANGVPRADLALSLQENYGTILTAILVGNNLVNIGAAAVATVLFTRMLGGVGPTMSTVVMTILILIFGEVTPKTLAKEAPERFAIFAARPIRICAVLFRPIDIAFDQLRKLLGRLNLGRDEERFIEEELKDMVSEAEDDGDIDEHESELIRSAIELTDQEAQSILTPRPDITCIEDVATMDEAQTLFQQSGYSRLPVIHEDLDHVVGILHEKDFYAARSEGVRDISRIMKPPVFAPVTLKTSKLLKLFQESKTHMVILVDEFGGTEGIVTMEDALEELVGEIWDEHDEVVEEDVLLEDGSRLVDGSMQLSELLEELHLADRYKSETVGGWTGEILSHIPVTGESFTEQGLRCTVTEMERHRVTKVRIEILNNEPNGGNEDGE